MKAALILFAVGLVVFRLRVAYKRNQLKKQQVYYE